MQLLSQNKFIKATVNLLIPVSFLLSFTVIGLFELLIRAKFSNTYPELKLNSLLLYIIYSNGLHIFSLVGAIISAVLFIIWAFMIVKNKGQNYLFELSRAIWIVLAVWAAGSLLIPASLYLLYKPVFD